MTSEDTDAKTRELVEKEGRYGMEEGQIIIVMQDKARHTHRGSNRSACSFFYWPARVCIAFFVLMLDLGFTSVVVLSSVEPHSSFWVL